MTIERQLEETIAETLKQLPEMEDAQIVKSRSVAQIGETKSENGDKASVVAVACGFRINDAFSLSPISLPISISMMTRAELDPTSEKHDAMVEAVADLISRWHKFGDEMSARLTSEKFLAGELRMDGGTARIYDQMNGTWTETITFTIRGSEKFNDI